MLCIPYLAIAQNVNINVHFEGDCMKQEHGFTDLVIEIENQSEKTAWIKYSSFWPCIRDSIQMINEKDVLNEWVYAEFMSPEDNKKIRNGWIKLKGNSSEILHVRTSRFDYLNLEVGKDYFMHSFYVKSGKRRDKNINVICNDLSFQMCE